LKSHEVINGFRLGTSLLIKHEFLVAQFGLPVRHDLPLVHEQHVLPLVRVEIDQLALFFGGRLVQTEQGGARASLLQEAPKHLVSVDFELEFVHPALSRLRVVPELDRRNARWSVEKETNEIRLAFLGRFSWFTVCGCV